MRSPSLGTELSRGSTLCLSRPFGCDPTIPFQLISHHSLLAPCVVATHDHTQFFVNTLCFPISMPWLMTCPAWNGPWPSVGSLKSYPCFNFAQLLPALDSLNSFHLFSLFLVGVLSNMHKRRQELYDKLLCTHLPASTITWVLLNNTLMPPLLSSPIAVMLLLNPYLLNWMGRRWISGFRMLCLLTSYTEETEA